LEKIKDRPTFVVVESHHSFGAIGWSIYHAKFVLTPRVLINSCANPTSFGFGGRNNEAGTFSGYETDYTDVYKEFKQTFLLEFSYSLHMGYTIDATDRHRIYSKPEFMAKKKLHEA